jgi:hypothetical protein
MTEHLITITLPAWFFWTFIILFVVDMAVKAVLIAVTRLNNRASQDLLTKLAQLALGRGDQP